MITEASGQSAGPGAAFIRHRRDIRSRHASSTWSVTVAQRNLESSSISPLFPSVGILSYVLLFVQAMHSSRSGNALRSARERPLMTAGDFGEKGISHVCAAPPFAGSVDLRVREQPVRHQPSDRADGGGLHYRPGGRLRVFRAAEIPEWILWWCSPGDLGCCGTGSRRHEERALAPRLASVWHTRATSASVSLGYIGSDSSSGKTRSAVLSSAQFSAPTRSR